MSKLSKLISKNSLRMIKYQLTDTYSSFKYRMNSAPSNAAFSDSKKISPSSVKENKRIYQKLISDHLETNDTYPFQDECPLVSIIVDLNGKTPEPLFKDFMDNLAYPNVELLVLNTGTSKFPDNIVKELEANLPIRIFENLDDNSYSKRINKAVECADGDYLVFIDGRIRTSKGWLNNLVYTALKTDNVGCVGGKLVYSEVHGSLEKSKLYKIRSIGTEFNQTSDGNFEESPMGDGMGLSSEICLKKKLRASISSEAILISKNRFLEFGGLDEIYHDYFQVSDLCLKLLKKGYVNLYQPNALLFVSADDKLDSKGKVYTHDSNIFNQNWGEFLAKNVLLDRIKGQNIYSIKKFKLGFAVSEKGEYASAGDYFTAKEFSEALKSFGWEISFLARDGDYWYDTFDLDVIVSLLYTFDPRRIKSTNSSYINIAWPRNWFDRWVFFPWFSSYDIVFTPSKKSQEYVMENSSQNPYLLPLATNPLRFNPEVRENKEYLSDYCFTGSYWNDPREIIDLLEPEELPYRFKLFGKNWDEIAKFRPYLGGFVNYSEIPQVYASTKIVVDDANRATKIYGSVNSRVYDALSSGALVLTNGRQGAEEIFKGMLPVFESKEELNNLLEKFLEEDDERQKLVKKLQSFVLKNHTYLNRAEQLKQTLIRYVEAKGV